jgi:hypothetical protein
MTGRSQEQGGGGVMHSIHGGSIHFVDIEYKTKT